MTAYAAVFSLTKTISRIGHTSHYTFVEPSLHILQFLFKVVSPWLDILVRLDETSPSRSRKKVNELDGRIKDKIWELQDILESHILYQHILSQSRNTPNGVGSGERDVSLSSIDMLHLLHVVGPFIRTLRDLKKDYIHELENMPEDKEEEEAISTRISTTGFGGTMIGLKEVFERLKSELMLTKEQHTKQVHALVGMAGVGKTTLANQIFQDPQITSHFECRAWVRVGRVPQLGQASRDLVAQLCGHSSMMKERLTGKKCLVVVDDVWETQVLDSLICSLPNTFNGSIQFLVTTQDRMVIANIAARIASDSFTPMRFLTEEESKELLRHRVFGDEELCPPQLDKAAAKIANKCCGLPLTIVTVADILSKSQNRDPEYWNDVAEERNSVFTDAYNEISKVLYPSYDYSPQYLKMPFLYMGVFPRDYGTSISKIINMLTIEGWLEESAWQCVQELCFNKHLVLSHRHSIFCFHDHRHMFNTCFLHSLWRPMYRGEARKSKFFHVLDRLVDAEEEVIKGQRCLCLQNNILFAIKKVSNLLRLHCASSTRSLLFLGPSHKYPIPIDVGFKLLWKLDALNLRFYIFPTEILTLVQLEYLALTCNGELPATISKLFNLRFLIIHPHVNIRCCRAPSYVPIRIWDMKELEYVEILGKSLVAPTHVASLEKLLTLVGVNASISTILELSGRIPNIRKLGVRVELTPYDDHSEVLSCFASISMLGSLETLKCSIINPAIKSVYAPSSLMLPGGLKKLHLSGTGFPWEYMDVIGSLPLLQVLKLRSFAFGGSLWEARVGSFLSLEFLQVEDTDLVCFNLRSGSFPKLTNLSMKHCYKLEKLLWPSVSAHRMIELVDCNPLASTCAKQLQQSSNTFVNLITTSHDLCTSCFHAT